MEPEGSLCSQDPDLNQTNPVCILTLFHSTAILVLPFHLNPDLPHGLFPSGFPTKILYEFLTFSTHDIPISSFLFNHPNNAWCRVQIKKLIMSVPYAFLAWIRVFFLTLVFDRRSVSFAKITEATWKKDKQKIYKEEIF
jgi:hypothetical protein